MKKNNEQVKIINEWYGIWDRTVINDPTQIFTGFLFKNGYQEFKKYLKGETFTLLEVGAGSGRYGFAFARAHALASVVVSDPTDSSVELMTKVKNELHICNANVSKEDALGLSFPDNTFDYVLADAVVQHIVDYPKAITEMLRVLKPGGKLLISTVNTYNPPHFLYKGYLKLFNKEYEYVQENTFTRKQLHKAVEIDGSDDIRLDGFAVAYGLSRLKKYNPLYSKLGSLLHKVIKVIDGVTGRWMTRRFGFEIFAVVTKTKATHEKTS